MRRNHGAQEVSQECHVGAQEPTNAQQTGGEGSSLDTQARLTLDVGLAWHPHMLVLAGVA